MEDDKKFVSRAGLKLEFGLKHFKIDVKDFVCVDFGCSTGGFTDCLLKRGASKVYSVDTAYGELDWNLRNNPQVEVHERQNALHFSTRERVDFAVSDVNWTKQIKIVPKIIELLTANDVTGKSKQAITLIKPHYETDPKNLVAGSLPDEVAFEVASEVRERLIKHGFNALDMVESPLKGKRAGNPEYLLLLST